MSGSHTIAEPHPSHPEQKPFRTGRGGAGNYSTTAGSLWTTKSTSPSSVPAARLTSSTGRGGAGNIGPSEAISTSYSLSEELAHQQTRAEKEQKGNLHIGRGGAGNLVISAKLDGQKHRQGSLSSTESGRSVRSACSGIMARIRSRS